MRRAWSVVIGVSVWVWSPGACASPVGAQEPGGPHLSLPQVVERGEAGPLLLLIPCAGCGARSWDRFMEVNEDRFRMIAVTLPGYDGSPRPDLPLWTGEPTFQDNAVARISELLDERDLDDVVVVGQSFGSVIGLLVAAARPARVRALVNVDGTPTNGADIARQTAEERLAAARSGVDETWAIQLQDPDRYRSFNAARRQPDAELQKLHHGMFMASDRVSMVHYWRENVLRDNNPTFRALAVPYLDVKAIYPWDANPDSTLAAHVASVDEIGVPPGYHRVVFHDTSHWVHLDRPRALGTVVERFLAGDDPTDVGPFRFGEVRVAGDGPRDVVLMPCLGCDAHAWDDFMSRNVDRYRMFAVTWPGMGDTQLPRVVPDPRGTPYYDFVVESLRQLIVREGIERPVIVGHSAAAVAAVRFATEHPELVSGVVNVDAVVANLDTYGYTSDERRAWADTEMSDVRQRYDDDEAWRALNAPPAGLPPDRAAFYSRMWLAPPRSHVLAYWHDWLRTDSGRLLPGLKVPFMAMHALPSDAERADAARADAQARYAKAPLPPGARVVFVEDSGHTIWEHRPAAFDSVLADFIEGTAVSVVR